MRRGRPPGRWESSRSEAALPLCTLPYADAPDHPRALDDAGCTGPFTRPAKHPRHAAASTSTRFVLYVVAPHGADRSLVSALAQPAPSVPSPSGVNHAPSLIETTPMAMRSVTLTGSTVEPRSLKTRTFWPSTMPRAFASSTCSQTSSGSTRASCGWLPWIEWVRARDLGLHSISGYFDCGSTGSNQVGIGGMTPRP